MFSSARRWLRHNRTPIAIGAGVIGAGYVVTQYVVSKISDARERMSSDRTAKENLRRRFEQNQEDCTFTVLALLPTATTNIMEIMKTESITYEIQQMKAPAKSIKSGSGDSTTNAPSIADTNLTEDDGKSSQGDAGVPITQITSPSPLAAGTAAESARSGGPLGMNKAARTKRQLWFDLTISAVTRSFTLLYTLALLTMLTRVQLNLLGRRSYLSSVVALATGTQQATINLENNDDDNLDQAYGSDFDINRKYLTFSWWLLNKGWDQIMGRVDSAVRTVFGTLSPRDLISFERISELTIEVRKLVEGATPEERRGMNWLQFLLPPQNLESQVLQQSGVLGDQLDKAGEPRPTSPALRRLLDETADLIESPAFSHVLTLILDAGFSALVDQELSREAFDLPVLNSNSNSTFPAPEIQDLRQTRVVQLPKVLSVLTRQAHAIGNGMPNMYLQEMEKSRDLEAFAAVVYSSNWENEIRDDGLAEAVAVGNSIEGTNRGSPRDEPLDLGEQSMVIVDAPDQFNGAWERATGKSS